jgi:hypothetical protein
VEAEWQTKQQLTLIENENTVKLAEIECLKVFFHIIAAVHSTCANQFLCRSPSCKTTRNQQCKYNSRLLVGSKLLQKRQAAFADEINCLYCL